MKKGPRRPRVHGELDKKKESTYSTAPGPVKITYLSPEEIAKIFKDVKPTKKPTMINCILQAKEAI